jgi:hypothetical protein
VSGTEEDGGESYRKNKAPHAYVLGGIARIRGFKSVPGPEAAPVVCHKVELGKERGHFPDLETCGVGEWFGLWRGMP